MAAWVTYPAPSFPVCPLHPTGTVRPRSLAGNWSSNVTFKQGHELVRSGPYRFVRHPIYSGLLIMFVGTALHVARLHCWLAVPVVVLGFLIKLRQEEALLLRHFPEAYPAYCRQVKALVPYVI